MSDYSDVKWKNNGKLKLMIIVGTRPEIIRLAAVINKTRKYFDVLLVHTGQNYDYNLNGVFFKDLKLADPEIYLNAVGQDLGETMGNIISESYKVMAELKPDAVLVLGDTNSCLSVIGAKRLHIPIFHMEAGNRCKDECLPEETNRRIVDIISDVNMAYSEHARRYLADTGISKKLKHQIFMQSLAWKKESIFCYLHTEKRILTRRKILHHCSMQSIRWRTSMTCQFFIPVIHVLVRKLRQQDFSWIKE